MFFITWGILFSSSFSPRGLCRAISTGRSWGLRVCPWSPGGSHRTRRQSRSIWKSCRAGARNGTRGRRTISPCRCPGRSCRAHWRGSRSSPCCCPWRFRSAICTWSGRCGCRWTGIWYDRPSLWARGGMYSGWRGNGIRIAVPAEQGAEWEMLHHRVLGQNFCVPHFDHSLVVNISFDLHKIK